MLTQTFVETVWKENGVVWFWLNRPSTRNALNEPLVQTLIQSLNELASNEKARVIVLSGRGGSFCSGGDVSELANLQHRPPIQRVETYRMMQQLVLKLTQHPLPVVAAVDGPAVGAGCDLALAADVVFASPRANFGETFVQAGLIPDFGGSFLLPKIIGWHRALDLLLTGKRIDATTALDMGIVNEITMDLEDSVRQWTDRICRRSRITVAYAKAMAWRHQFPSLAEELSQASMVQSLLMDTDGHQSFVQTFLSPKRGDD